uniref:STAS domain-containing protein n=1 Tax=Magnetococcus massalia (strain MO-1) TaxID=451514 RepID=A0A1S7LD05_MAGMO|nr:protein of unknown function. Putative antisigma-factor antagonist STAS [Candidatus Magnetococcus massalia]
MGAPITKRLCPNTNRLTITLPPELNFSTATKLMDCCREDQHHAGLVDLDMVDVEKIDSSGLGTLLIIREHFTIVPNLLNIINVKDHVKEVLLSAKFDRLFAIKEASGEVMH